MELLRILESFARDEPEGLQVEPLKLKLSKAGKGAWTREEI